MVARRFVDRAWAPLATSLAGGLILAGATAWLPAIWASLTLLAGLVLAFVGVSMTGSIRESALAPVAATASMMGALSGFGATGLLGHGVLAPSAAFAAGAALLGLAGAALLPFLVRDVRRRATATT